MKYAFLYHLNAYTYGDPNWFPNMSPELRAMFNKITKGALSGNEGEPAKQDWKVNGEYVEHAGERCRRHSLSSTPMSRRRRMEFLDEAAKSDKPFFINVNFMKNHQPNMPAPDFIHKSISKSKYADSVVELDSRVGDLLKKLDDLGLADNTIVFYTVDNGAWQDVYPDAGYTPFREHQGHGPRRR